MRANGDGRTASRWVWALVALSLGACGTTRTQVVELEPMRFEAVPTEDGAAVEVLEPEVLFREGGAAFAAGDYETAARKYGLVVTHFPDSRWGTVSRYNAGLALEKARRWAEAIPHFTQVAALTAGSKDAHDALFRLASCHEALEDWRAADAALSRVLAPEFEGIVAIDRLEALARRGRARQLRGDLALAERDYLAALELYRHNLANRAFSSNAYVSLAQFQIGEIYRALFQAIQFRLPLERMARDLEDKANYFLKAQHAYLKAVRMHHPEYAMAAGYRLGAIFESFYDDMMAAEVPDDLSKDELAVYYDELRRKVKPLLTKAIDIYERNIRLGERFGQTDEWVRKTQASLSRLKDLLRQESAREAQAEISVD